MLEVSKLGLVSRINGHQNSLNDDVITWDSQGRAVIIKDPSRFSAELLPKYFNHSNLFSFVRQVSFVSN